MNRADALTGSDAIESGGDTETFSDKDPLRSFNGLTRQRIHSFFHDPSLEPDEIEGEAQARRNNLDSLPLTVQKKAPIAFVPKRRYHPRTFTSLQKWEGYVVEVHEDLFIARITDLDGMHEDEEIEVMFSEISEDDRERIAPGAIFYWHIGYEAERGTVKRSSIIRFRRMPRWTQSDIRKAASFHEKIKLFLEGPEE